ncbi:hypothetical protein I3760_01G051800 [Carya illinoinensis]|nr:hypothetical protein I3760_01G051800 [Carya illinoinensis]KAG2725123.1 hypothetical protein I3760_01G051800 [Carya illinoinensis]
MELPTYISNTSSATSKIVGSELDNRADGEESEAPLGSPLVEERTEERPNLTESNSGSLLKSHNVQVVDDDTIEEPKSGMKFNSLEELLCYYKEYGKKYRFGVMTKRTDREENDSVRYVTLCCARGGNVRNRTLNIVDQDCSSGFQPENPGTPEPQPRSQIRARTRTGLSWVRFGPEPRCIQILKKPDFGFRIEPDFFL